MTAVQCPYCNRPVPEQPAAPTTDREWAALATAHAADCEFVRQRGRTLPNLKLVFDH